MNRNYLQRAIVLIGLMGIAATQARGQQNPAFENPIAIDGLAENYMYVLSERGTIYRTFPKNGSVGYSILARISPDLIPIDLSVSAGKNQASLGARTALIVLANSKKSTECMVLAFDGETGAQLVTWPLAGRCGGIDIFPGEHPYAYITIINDNSLFRLDVSSKTSRAEFVTKIDNIGRVGAIAIAITARENRWFVADATGDGIVLVTQSAGRFDSEKVAGVNTSVSSLRMGDNHYLYATDTSKRRVFHLEPRGKGFVVDVRPQIEAELSHPSGIATSDGTWFAVTDDTRGTVLFCDKTGKIKAKLP